MLDSFLIFFFASQKMLFSRALICLDFEFRGVTQISSLKVPQGPPRSLMVPQVPHGHSRSLKVPQGPSRSPKVPQGPPRSLKVPQGPPWSLMVPRSPPMVPHIFFDFAKKIDKFYVYFVDSIHKLI